MLVISLGGWPGYTSEPTKTHISNETWDSVLCGTEIWDSALGACEGTSELVTCLRCLLKLKRKEAS